MILQCLTSYYHRLQADPEIDIPEFGFSRQKISFCVVLNNDGSLHEIIREYDDVHVEDVPRPKIFTVPGATKPSGAGINPCFLWDNSGYMLGFKPEDPKPERSLQTFKAFQQKHMRLMDSIDDPDFDVVCRFLSQWDPSNAKDHPILLETTKGFGVFRLRGKSEHVHQRPAVEAWWVEQLNHVNTRETVVGQCLLTGENSSIARLHEPRIKGVAGAQTAGAAVVSFNESAYESYGRSQSYNAPVSEAAAFQYSTALNHLLSPDSGRCIRVGDATTVFWSESNSVAEELFAFIADPVKAATTNEATKNSVNGLLTKIKAGATASELGIGHGDQPFYVLGLSPNAARLSVRFWSVKTLDELVASIRQHFQDLDIARSGRDPEFPAVWQLLTETARESKDIRPVLGGALMRAILTGSAYPQMLFGAVIRRIRADGDLRAVRAGILKAYLNRNLRLHNSSLETEITMALDPERPEPAYQLGRLFAELEKTQQDAIPSISDTIKDRFFGVASATPRSVFPTILRTSQHHLKKLDSGRKSYHEKSIQEICSRFDEFPSHLNLNGQGLFALGYYHQRQSIFTKKTTAEVVAA